MEVIYVLTAGGERIAALRGGPELEARLLTALEQQFSPETFSDFDIEYTGARPLRGTAVGTVDGRIELEFEPIKLY